jgi:hypothetical protein
MREEISDEVAKLTGRNVLAMMSANHVDPDLAAEIYVLDGPPIHNHATIEESAEPAPTIE